MINTEVLRAATSELGNSSSYSMCRQNPIYRSRLETFLHPSKEKPYKVLMPALGSDVERCFYVQSCMMVKKDIEIQPGFEPGSSEF